VVIKTDYRTNQRPIRTHNAREGLPAQPSVPGGPSPDYAGRSGGGGQSPKKSRRRAMRNLMRVKSSR
jgi:hypothetical protein